MNNKNIQIDFNFSRPIDFQKNTDSLEFNKLEDLHLKKLNLQG